MVMEIGHEKTKRAIKAELALIRNCIKSNKEVKYYFKSGGWGILLCDIEEYKDVYLYVTHEEMKTIHPGFTIPKQKTMIPYEDRRFKDIPHVIVHEVATDKYVSVVEKYEDIKGYKFWI